MKNTLLPLACILIFSCTTNTDKSVAVEEKVDSNEIVAGAVSNIPFVEAKNYFVKNTFTADSLAAPKISSQKDFDVVFGAASTMSANGKPTPIDFTKQYAIAVIQPVTGKATTLSVNSLVQQENNIVLHYTKAEGEKQSFTTRPFILLIVDGTYSGDVVVKQQ